MILWINLVTNGLPALALGVDPPEEHLMREPPRNPNEGLLRRRDYFGILYVGVVMGAAAVALYAIEDKDPETLRHTRAMAFSLLALSPLFHAWSCRSPVLSVIQTRPLFSVPLFIAGALSAGIHLVAVLVPGLRPVFRTFAMSTPEWLLLLGLAALIVPAVELAKLGYRRARPADASPPPSRAG
jgi:P-type Ca2+ transporter type 2C